MFTAVVRITGAGRLDDFRERLRWLMVRDEDAEDYTEHHAAGTLEYRFAPRRGIPFPAFTAASVDFPELRVEAEWERDGKRGRAVIENGQLVEQTSGPLDGAQVDVQAGDEGHLELGLACMAQPDGSLIGYAVTHARHTYWRYRGGVLDLLGTEEPDAALEEVAFRFVEEWIWYDEEEAALERVRYANYGYPVRGANLKSEKLALLRANRGSHSSLDPEGKAAREAIVRQWLKP
ncbi:MAG TPA: hypothetical protein VIG70_15830 [Burkholderiales bacterium]|jgi:hypothetical protein